MREANRRIPVYAFHPPPTLETGVVRQSSDDDGFYLPLALGMIVESARADEALAGRFDLEGPPIFSQQELLEEVARRGPGVALFSSYVWNAEANLAASRALKALAPACVTVHGGPSTPKHPSACEAFLRENPHVDATVRGEGELTVRALLHRIAEVAERVEVASSAALASPPIPGVAARLPDGTIVRGADPARIDALDALPSPYLTGFFDRALEARARHGRATRMVMATLETNRGCPYQCAFCDWGSLTLQKIRAFGAERVRAELEWIGAHEIHAIFLGDANFGILPRDLEIAGVIADVRRRLGWPREVVANYAKNGSDFLAEIFRTWKEADVSFEPTISIQSQDPPTLRTIRRANVKPAQYARLSDVYRSMGLRSRVHLMMGLPGQTFEAWKDDLEFVFRRQEAAQIFPTRMLPNSPMAEPAYVAEHRLRVDATATIVESAAFGGDEWRAMGRLACGHLVALNWGLLRYALMFLEWEHGLRAVDVLHAWVEAIHARGAELRASEELLGPLLAIPPAQLCGATVESFRTAWRDGFDAILAELARFVGARFGVALDAPFEAVLAAQVAVLPRSGGAPSRRVPLAHDVATYVREGCAAMRRGDRPARRLAELPPATLEISDPLGRNRGFDPIRLRAVTGGDPGWELASALDRAAHGEP